MNGSRESVRELLTSLVNASENWSREVIVCPPFVFLSDAQMLLHDSPIRLGAQNVNAKPSGAFTGEIAVGMLKEFGCQYAIVGHSERRIYFGETDHQVAEKFAACVEQGVTPILCVGETGREREEGRTAEVVERQLTAVVEHVGIEQFAASVVAYEPVWAIGTGVSATAAQAQEVHAAIRGLVARSDASVAEALPILYGGSVTDANAQELFAEKDIDGALVGGASLDAAGFAEICAKPRPE